MTLNTIIRNLLLTCLILLSGVALADPYFPNVSEKRIVFSTRFGDLVFALYSEDSPIHVKQLLKLTELGVYDYGKVMRVIPNFIIQFSDRHRRQRALTKEQADAITTIKAEFSSVLKHTKGLLTMARFDNDVDSATMSFSILLGNAPHLDNKYTIFGYLESGGSVVDKILSIPLKGETPTSTITVTKAFVIHDADAYYAKNPVDPVEGMGRVETKQIVKSTNTDKSGTRPNLESLITILMIAIILVSLLGVLLNKHLSQSRLVSLLLVNVLIAGFGIFIIVTPATSGSNWLGFIVFMGLFGLFRLMSRFEKSS
jgi:cyclophilin family peptidyl-prolyl cis-trans isomerase